jgi:hypothetical protein
MRGHPQRRGSDTGRLKVYVGRDASGTKSYVERTVNGTKRRQRVSWPGSSGCHPGTPDRADLPHPDPPVARAGAPMGDSLPATPRRTQRRRSNTAGRATQLRRPIRANGDPVTACRL